MLAKEAEIGNLFGLDLKCYNFNMEIVLLNI